MAIYLEKRNRIIIPRWREYNALRLTGDILPLKDNIQKNRFQNDPNLIDKIDKWHSNPNFSTALEVVNSSYALGQEKLAIEQAKYILDNRQGIPNNLKKVINSILNLPQEENILSDADSGHDTFFKHIGRKVNDIRKRLIAFPHNSLLWIELSRLHSILGNIDKAKNCIVIALNLSNNNNRFVTRSASRFFFHIKDHEQALYTIKKSPYLLKDPWLIASDISYSIALDRTSTSIKKAKYMLESKNYNSKELSDLAGMLGTLEFRTGAIKNAKKLFQTSLIQPNENSLAQAEWASHNINNLDIEPWIDNMPEAHEARANEALFDYDINTAFTESCKWMLDQPFSKRAALLSSYIASGLKQDFKDAIKICEASLRTNPNDFGILNNYIFSLAHNKQVDLATKLLPRLHSLIKHDFQKITYHATFGLVLYKQGLFTEGKVQYLQAIEIADKIKRYDYQQHARINFLREEYYASKISKTELISALRKIKDFKQSMLLDREASSIIDTITNTLTK